MVEIYDVAAQNVVASTLKGWPYLMETVGGAPRFQEGEWLSLLRGVVLMPTVAVSGAGGVDELEVRASWALHLCQSGGVGWSNSRLSH